MPAAFAAVSALLPPILGVLLLAESVGVSTVMAVSLVAVAAVAVAVLPVLRAVAAVALPPVPAAAPAAGVSLIVVVVAPLVTLVVVAPAAAVLAPALAPVAAVLLSPPVLLPVAVHGLVALTHRVILAAGGPGSIAAAAAAPTSLRRKNLVRRDAAAPPAAARHPVGDFPNEVCHQRGVVGLPLAPRPEVAEHRVLDLRRRLLQEVESAVVYWVPLPEGIQPPRPRPVFA